VESPLLSRTGLLVLALVGVVVTATNVERYRDPVGEKYVPLLRPGAADFTAMFAGARALALGIDPYHNERSDLADPWKRHFEIDGRAFNLAYPPAQLLLYLPLAELTADSRQAGRILFWINLLILFALSLLTWRLVLWASTPSKEERHLSALLVPVLFFVLAANVASSLGLERGQDFLNALLCWGALALFLKGHRFLPGFLLVSAVLIKGYALVLALGLILLGSPRGGWKGLLGGSLAAAALWIAPAWRYLPDGLEGALWRTRIPVSSTMLHGSGWLTYGFETFFFLIFPDWANPLRIAMCLVCLLVTAACFFRALRAFQGSEHEALVLWLCLFATCALTTLIGYSRTSFIYTFVLILPGVMVFLLLGEAYARGWGLRGQGLFGAAQLLLAFLLFRFKIEDWSFPFAAAGLFALVSTIGLGFLAGALRARAARATNP
jgi:hypothetical protein